MPASVQIRQLTGADGTTGAVDKTSGTIRFQTLDTTDQNSLANAIAVPASGQNYSMRVVLRAYIASGTFTQISAPVWYSDGANNFGLGRKLWYQMAGSYTQPAIPTASNDPPQFPGATPMLDWFGATSGSPADGDAVGPNAGPFDSTGLPKYIGDFLNFVFEVEAAASQGITPSESVTFAWSEI